MIYDYECMTCGAKAEVECKMSERDEKWPECPEHGAMEALITNNVKHLDNTETRKGHFNSSEGRHR